MSREQVAVTLSFIAMLVGITSGVVYSPILMATLMAMLCSHP